MLYMSFNYDRLQLHNTLLPQMHTELSIPVTIRHLTRQHTAPLSLKSLDLQSSSSSKVHEIENLQRFPNLQILVLSNNLIHEMKGLSSLTQLKVLNLEFNNIEQVRGTENLADLQELYLSHNQICCLGTSLRCNCNLRVLHLAYNELASIEDLAVLLGAEKYQQHRSSQSQEDASQQPNAADMIPEEQRPALKLQELSLKGNPILETLNYIRFMKMLVPSLVNVDGYHVVSTTTAYIPVDTGSQHMNQTQKKQDSRFSSMGKHRSSDGNWLMSSGSNRASRYVTTSIQPQEEVLILREAIDGLLDERDEYLKRLSAQNEKIKKVHEISDRRSVEQHLQVIEQEKMEWVQILSAMRDKYKQRLESQRRRISELSQVYTGRITGDTRTRSQQPTCNPSENRGLLKELKELEHHSDLNKIKLKRVVHLLTTIQDCKQECIDTTRLILEYILLGQQSANSLTREDSPQQTINMVFPKYFKVFKRYLVGLEVPNNQKSVLAPNGLVGYTQLLLTIIFGEMMSPSLSAGSQVRLNPYTLKAKIESKNLLEIISELKTASSERGHSLARFNQEREKFVQKFEEETQILSSKWEELNQSKNELELLRSTALQKLSKEHAKKEDSLKRKYSLVEQEEKARIRACKEERGGLEDDINAKKETLAELESRIGRKLMELEEFERHFNLLILEKDKIQQLSGQLTQIEVELQTQESRLSQARSKLEETKLEQAMMDSRLNNLAVEIHDKRTELQQIIEDSSRVSHEKDLEIQLKTNTLRSILAQIEENSLRVQDNAQLEKQTERLRKNYALCEDKLRNLEKIQTNKRNQVKGLQSEHKMLEQQNSQLLAVMHELQGKIDLSREEEIRYDMKIRENRLALDSLADLNKSIGDMVVRQSELKRANIELEIENKNLLEVNNSLREGLR